MAEKACGLLRPAACGLACGLAALAAGMAIGIVGDAGVRANAQQPKLFVGMILILIFAEALALYGLIGELRCQGHRCNFIIRGLATEN